jgi:hypothetical protein
MKWNVSQEEIAKGKIIKPGWHPVVVVDYEEAMNKAKDAMNAIVTLEVSSGEFKGVQKKVYFSEKAPGTMTGFLEAIGCKVGSDGTLSADLSKNALVNKKLQANFIRGEYNNRPTNEITEYAAIS